MKPNEEENKEKGEPENKEQEKGKKKREFLVYKYCNRKKGDLHEAVILGGKPAFLKYTSGLRELASLYNDDRSKKPSLDWRKSPFGHKPTSLQKVFANANKTMEKSTKFINKIKSRQLACASRAKSIPGNATIRKEYIKCGKQMCEIEHGPYYYAYWKDPQVEEEIHW